MGTGSKAASKPAAIAPAAPPPAPVGGLTGSPGALASSASPASGVPGGPLPPGGSAAGAAVSAELEHAAGLVEQLKTAPHALAAAPPLAGDQLTRWYDRLAGTAGEFPLALSAAVGAGATAQQAGELQDAFTDATGQALGALSPEQLTELATAKGFKHAALLAGTPGASSPLAAWLNPAYPPDSPGKALIQAKAIERHDNLGAVPAGRPPGSTPGGPAPETDGPLAKAAQVLHGFSAKHAKLVQALAHAKATAADLPARLDPATVTAASFGPGEEAGLGGIHSKTVHDGPGGGKWLFKPDKQAGGARAHAEAAASAVLHAGGVPSVPVYPVQIGGHTGAAQPLIKGASTLPPSPASWNQAEVDAMVRYHVAAWVAGDHDGNPENILRTPSGGMVPIDQGQAFKFYGSDKLDISYHPNSSHGTARPVFHQAYEAHLAGKLGEGVSINPAVAHPVIKAYESVPDAKWRAMLHDTAHEGAAHSVAWVPAMRARAAKKHAVASSAVTTTQIAEAFLDHACERKNSLRKDFADFFTGQAGLPGGAALRHAPGSEG